MTKQKLTVGEFELELKKRYRELKKQDRTFSVRSLATKLDVLESSLQKIMRGERSLGYRLAQDIAKKLNVEVIRERGTKVARKKGWTLSLDSDSATQVSWLNLAILEMLKLEGFQANESWIAKRLGLPVNLVTQALDEMENEKMLRREKNGVWVDLMADSSTGAAGYRSTEVIRKMQKDLLHLSAQKLDSIPYEKREHGFSMMPVSKKQLPMLKKRIQQFHWELCELAQNAKLPKDEIYSLEVGFFSVTQ